MAKLSAKQKKFVHEYLKDLNATQAATRAGYSKRTANEQGARLLANVSVQTYLQEKQQKIQEKNELTVDWVLDSLKEIHARCMQAEAVRDNQGNETGEFKFESRSAIKAIELLGRHIGMFTPERKSDDNKSNTTPAEPPHVIEARIVQKINRFANGSTDHSDDKKPE